MASPRIVVGLGNPGPEYCRTRHNLGFRVLDRLAERAGANWCFDRAAEAWVAQGTPGHHPSPGEGAALEGPAHAVVLAKPQTFMNRSGHAASELCRRFAVAPDELLVVYDDADLDLGRLRLRPHGTAGGHNGLQSVIDVLGTIEIPRLRLGVRGAGRGMTDLATYVLAPFEADEEPVAEAVARTAADAVEDILEHGLAAAMNRHNAPPPAP